MQFTYPHVIVHNVYVHYWLLSFAVLLLWFPRQWLRFGGTILTLPSRPPVDKNLRDTKDVSLHLIDELFNLRNWIDLLRAFAGSIAVFGMRIGTAHIPGCFERMQGAPKGTADIIFSIQCVVFLITILVQMTRNFQDRVTLVAPVFFIFGLSFGIIGPLAAVFACIAVWVVNLLLPSSGVFLLVFAVLEVLFAKFLSSGVNAYTRTLIMAVALAIMPVLLSAMFNRRLVKLNKKVRVSVSKSRS